MQSTQSGERKRGRSFYSVIARLAIGAIGLAIPARALTATELRVLPPGKLPEDRRLQGLVDLNGYFPFSPAANPQAWQSRAERLRRQLLVATGLWPMPERGPAKAIVHGRVEREGYTVERVILESVPGHFVTGSLYRPTGMKGKRPGVLCPHGHWPNGRFYDAGDEGLRRQIADGGEKFSPSGRYPLQARCVQLARMGCVVFHYDMVGYADSVQIPQEIAHGFRERRPAMEKETGWGFFSPQAELRLQTIMGLQTLNSIRALDWICELPDVDPQRIGVTGASGGGTQTFVFCAIDPRPAAAFPAVMVSTAMQGGCTCENCSYLRVGTGNVELAALIAPRPLAMTAANDWTKEMASKGFPQLQRHYTLLGVPDNVGLTSLTQYDHNYNYPSRKAMYEWFNKHLQLGQQSPIDEQDFKPLTVDEMTVWSEAHPRPSGDQVGEAHERTVLRRMAEESDRRLGLPWDGTAGQPLSKEQRETFQGAWDAIIGRGLPAQGQVTFERTQDNVTAEVTIQRGLLRNAARGEESPAVILRPAQERGETVLWLDKRGKAGLFNEEGAPSPAVSQLLRAGLTVVGIDLMYQGESLADGKPLDRAPKVAGDRNYAGFTYGYNPTVFAWRVHDVLSTIGYLREARPTGRVHLAGLDEAAAWAAAATVQSEASVSILAVDGRTFRFAKVGRIDHPDFVPGGVKYGDLPVLLAIARPDCLIQMGSGSTSARLAASGEARPRTVVTLPAGAEPREEALAAKMVEEAARMQR